MISRQGGSGARQVDDETLREIYYTAYTSKVGSNPYTCHIQALRAVVEFLGEWHEPEPVETLGDIAEALRAWKSGGITRGSIEYALNKVFYEPEPVRCDYCGDELPSVKHRSHLPTTPDLQRRGFAADKIVCGECAAKPPTPSDPRFD